MYDPVPPTAGVISGQACVKIPTAGYVAKDSTGKVGDSYCIRVLGVCGVVPKKDGVSFFCFKDFFLMEGHAR
jgi:hypothetical protein